MKPSQSECRSSHRGCHISETLSFFVLLTYDANGNQTLKTLEKPDGTMETWSYSYDIDNHLTTVCKDNVMLAAYAYDIFGRRIRAAEGNTLTVFLYSEGKVIYEERYAIAAGTKLSDALTAALTGLTQIGAVDYVRAGETPLAKFDLEVGGSGETVTYYHADHLGSTRLRTDALGNLVGPEDQRRMDYEPFGALLGGSSITEPYAYTGQRADAGTGLYYYGARFYDQEIGRFITADSWTNLPDDERGYMVGQNPGWYNQYAYVIDNPIRYNDPTGHDSTLIYEAEGSAYGSVTDEEVDALQEKYDEYGVNASAETTMKEVGVRIETESKDAGDTASKIVGGAEVLVGAATTCGGTHLQCHAGSPMVTLGGAMLIADGMARWNGQGAVELPSWQELVELTLRKLGRAVESLL